MKDIPAFIKRFHTMLPEVREWIDGTLEEHHENAVPVCDYQFPQLGSALPRDLLSEAMVVVVQGQLPFPSMSRMGLPELAQMEDMNASGVT